MLTIFIIIDSNFDQLIDKMKKLFLEIQLYMNRIEFQIDNLLQVN